MLIETLQVKHRPDDQMTSCFLKLYTPARVCEIVIRNWSAGQPETGYDIGGYGGSSRKDAREMLPEGTKSRHRMPGNGHTKETYERDGTEMSVMRTRCERFRPGKVESRKPKDTQKTTPKWSRFFVVPTGISLASSS